MFRPITVGLAAFALIALACSSGGESTTGDDSDNTTQAGLSQTASAGGIDVKATWQAPDAVSDGVDLKEYPANSFLFLEVSLDTHSGDLMSIDFPDAAEFRQGNARFEATDWVSVNDDAHHRKGLLVVAREFEEGPVELALQLGDDSLSLTWDSIPKA